ncbi:alpha/beta fold hydrolase [Salinicoccus sp. HZC-1]|uniref:alpha/beta fold hydrolase n=1 Tax=Salinicoccus sp. HZC-1 TaxID=3385497 RepID=UPI00398A6824
MILHTENIGSGSETIVFLHSGLQTGMTDFENIIPVFKDAYHILLPDLRGHGKSRCDNLDDYFESAADDLMETIENLNITKIHLVGVSLGAIIAVHFALRHKSYVRTLNLSGIMFKEPHNYTELHNTEVNIQANLLENQEVVSYFDNLHGSGWKQFLEIGKNREWYPFAKNAQIIEENLPIHIILGSRSDHELETIDEHIEKKASVTIVKDAGHLVNHDNAIDFSKSVLNYIQDK